MKKYLMALGLTTTLLTACTNGTNTPQNTENTPNNQGIGGTLKVVTSRTDAEKLFEVIEKDFIAQYPEVTDIIWESSADYDNYITTRMNTTDYGDVLFIPFSMSGEPQMYPEFFEPLGTVEELSKTYIDVTEADFEGVVYGLPAALNTLGMIYNKAVLEQAGIEVFPTTQEAFIEACEQIKEKTDAIPFFTNYERGLGTWGGTLSSFGGENYKAETLEKGTAFEEGQPIREVMDLFYELTSEGYTEPDPITLDFAKGKQMLAEGKIAMMMKGSQDAKAINALDPQNSVAIAPIPVMRNGKTSLALGAPEVVGINVNSQNKETARAFLDFFISQKSQYAADLGGMSPSKDDLTAEEKQLFENNNIVLTAPQTSPDVEVRYNQIANEVGVARLTDVLQQVINKGLYPDQSESYEDYVEELHKRWEKAAGENGQ